ncbi:MAG: UDP-N-acetylglucosamine--N-acetylmuramyl-(pentapeptide) pyrophosphoryl-undecaprenol N-acetylglucosamine transferase [Planctomycetes bacterium]|nr:UDP-N-acetylglucosamine--N-acetylmuramyl-(pentapeptide) pyrophosphoryl-undecaprenol N-acetylglucosamine transferase [Planctomycetota bacterium]
MTAAPHILFAGGGAAGYFFPGIAVAEHLNKSLPQATITFAGPGRAREKHAVRTAGHEYVTILSQPIPQNPLQALRFLTDNAAGYCAARWMLRERGVNLVVGLGGYTSTAVVRAAVAREIPFLLLEQNSLPSRTTRWLSEAASLVCAGFEEVRPHLHVQAPVAITGNPARPVFEQLCRRMSSGGRSLEAAKLSLTGERHPRQKRLVVLGGADGARSLNQSIPKALKQLGEALSDWQIIHQTGEGQLQETENRYRQCGLEALTVTFIDEIASVLFASDLVVCRSGGTTLAELALAGVPAVLVPYPHAVDDQQIANAKVFTSAGACRLVDESSQGGMLDKALARELTPLVVDEALRREMSLNIHALARPDAAADIAAAIQETLGGNRSERLAA